MATNNTDLKGVVKTIETTLDNYLVKKAPAIPPDIQNIIVTIMPWLTLIFMIMAIPAILVVLGIGAVITPFAYMSGADSMMMWVGLLLTVPAIIFEAMAIPGLFNRTRQGWNYVFYATLITAVHNLITFNVVGLIVGTLLSLYILFQVKNHYK